MNEKNNSGTDSETESASMDKEATVTNDSDEKKEEPGKDLVQELEEKLDEAKEETAQTYDRYLRVAADFENYKKRTTREMDDLRKYAKEALLKDLLTAVDNLERALDSCTDAEKQDQGIVQGVDMTLKELIKILEKNQVKPVDAVGEKFDPTYHQAFMTEESKEHPENTVIRELQKGYTLHDRLLRPAMVVVAKDETEIEAKAPEGATDNN